MSTMESLSATCLVRNTLRRVLEALLSTLER